ncbi:hypothetical protein C9374_011043 [Naegleria lovaniensis]|uniref:Uncharacterized protein n=1 Tax=Naegleria lovaniensis TaxID=51637 RepID=A0AA88GHG9_NAELO|nr:uncharacterized protein C9374_011043 [Naegleria lovaniensis]KAG2374206.1 hypothetical protein C9374_011043 [Naegleria lovaniensis]
MMVAALLLCLYRSAQVASASPTTSSRLNLKTLVRESAELYHAPHYAQVMTEIQKARDSSSPNDLYSDFKTGTWHTGDFETYDENCVENTFVFVNLTIPNSYSMILSAPFQPADRILLSACLKGLKDSYHLCGIKVENISSSACVRFHYDEKLETVKVAINLNSLSCMAPTFDYDGKCSLEESSIPEFIFYYSAPGDNSMMLRNVVAIVVLSLLVCCCACVGVVGGYFGYRYFKNRNNTKKPSHSGNIQLDPQEQYAELEDI